MPRWNALADRFWPKVEKTDGCWLWRGGLKADGYGLHHATGAHRISYQLLVGDIPAGLTVDHLCRNRVCVNPSHMELVTHAENCARAARSRKRCRQGHLYGEDNVRMEIQGNGPPKRRCLACKRITNAYGSVITAIRRWQIDWASAK